MTDDRPQSVDDQFPSVNSPADHDETNWGEDWESAFQAEDDAFFSDGKEDDFFLEENSPTVSAGTDGQELDSSLEKTLSGIPVPAAPSRVHTAKIIFDKRAILTLFLSAKTTVQKQFVRFQSFPLFVRIPLYALPFLLAGIVIFLNGTSETVPPLEQPATPSTRQATVSPDKAKSADGAPDARQMSRIHPGKVRKKWLFPEFIIPVNNPAADQAVVFVLVDITLIASLNEQEDLPADKTIFVRDIIYQFFQNKPLDQLRRFSLARGDMNRELRAWLQKQWPEAPIESIIFNQYHLS